jgi:cytochrome b561
MSANADPVASRHPGYDRVATWLHWLIGVALIGQIAFGFLLDEIAPRGTPARAPTINLHKSIGIVLGLLIVGRVAWRLTHAAPPWPASLSPLQQRAAVLGHRALYACMLLMPISGYVASNFSKYGVRFFGVALPPWGPESSAVYAFFNGVHVTTAYVFAALIAGHVAMALRHAAVNRHEVFGRINRFA